MAIFTGLVIVFDTATGLWNYETLTVTDYDNYVGDGYQSNAPAIGTMTLNGDEVPVPFGEGTGYILAFSYMLESGVSNTTFKNGLRLDDTHFILPIDNEAMTILPGIAIEDLSDLALVEVVAHATGVLSPTSTWQSFGLREPAPVLPDPEGTPWDSGAQTVIVAGGQPLEATEGDPIETTVDLFLKAGVRYSFVLEDEKTIWPGLDTQLNIYNPDGSYAASSLYEAGRWSGHVHMDFIADTSGTYSIDLRHYGYFTLAMDADDYGEELSSATWIENGASITAHLTGVDLDTFRVDLAAGEQLNATLADLPGYEGGLAGVSLLDADGDHLEFLEITDSVSLSYTATQSETVYLRVLGSESSVTAGVSRYLLSLGDDLPVQTYGAGNDAILIDMRSDDSAMIVDTGGSNTLTILADTQADGVARGFESNTMVGTAGGDNLVDLENLSKLDFVDQSSKGPITIGRKFIWAVADLLNGAIQAPSAAAEDGMVLSSADVTFTIGDDTLTFRDLFVELDTDSPMATIQQFRFADGAVLDVRSNAEAGGDGDDLMITLFDDRDTLGGNGDDILLGGDLDDTLNGGRGTDQMIGGSGDDTYVVGQLRDVVMETVDAGHDHVRAGVSYTLGDHIEDLTLTGRRDINGTGNGLDNTISGNRSGNILDGGLGNDLIRGGAGADVIQDAGGNDLMIGGNDGDLFVLVEGFGRDRIQDFDTAEGDRIDVSALSGIIDFDDLTAQHLSQRGRNVLLRDGEGNSLTLAGVNVADLSADDFLF